MAGSHTRRTIWRAWLDRIRPSRTARHGDGPRDVTVPRARGQQRQTVDAPGTAWERHDDPTV